MGVLHVGTDGAGSVRLPAHFCGVVGMKPTYGAVPYVPIPNNDGLSHVGPIARWAEDAAAMLRAMAGPDPADPTTLPEGLLDLPPAREEARCRVAYSPDLGHLRVDPEVRSVLENALRQLEADLGWIIEEATPPWGPEGPALIDGFWTAGLRHHLDRPAEQVAMLDPGFAACLRDAPALSLADYVRLRGQRLAYAAAVNSWLGRHDVLVTPAASVAAFDAGRVRPAHWPDHQYDWIAWAGFSYPFNLAHAPTVVVPAGVTPDGLPVGMQLAAPRFHDADLLRLAARCGKALRPTVALSSPPVP